MPLSASFSQLLRDYDLTELYGWAEEMFARGATDAEIANSLYEQDVVKRKYKAIFDRQAKGLPPTSIAEIVEYRRRASALEQFYGLPTGYVSSLDNVNRAITGDVSFSELETRVQTGARMAWSQPPEVRSFLRDAYGVNEGDMVAFFVDPEHAIPFLERTVTSAQVGGMAARQGFGLTREEAEMLTEQGVDGDQAAARFGELAASREITGRLVGDPEEDMARQEQLAAVSGVASARMQLERRRRQRQAVFEAGGGFSSGEGMIAGTAR